MRSQWNSGQVEVKATDSGIEVRITPLGGGATTGVLKYPKGLWLFRIFMLSWWRWRSICRIAEKEEARREKVDKQNQIKWEREQVDEALIRTFPEIIEDQLFGDDDV